MAQRQRESERCKGKEGWTNLHGHADAPHLVDDKNVMAAQDAQHTVPLQLKVFAYRICRSFVWAGVTEDCIPR